MAKRTAIIDIGSNSVRLSVYERTSRYGFHLMHEAKSRVRIGEDAYEHGGYLQDEPQERAIHALEGFANLAKSLNARKTLCVATSALRDAPNSGQFLKRVLDETTVKIKIIDGLKEAELGGIACAALVPLEKGITIDIGGGSTEFALFENGRVLDTYSLNLGTVRLKELFFDNNDIKGAKEYIRNAFEELPKSFRQKDIAGIGGTIRTLSKLIMSRTEYSLDKLHGFSYKPEEHQEFFDEIINAKNSAKLATLGIKKDRFDVIKPGTLIFSEIFKLLGAKRVTASGVGVREGLFLSDLLRGNALRFPANFNPNLRNLLDRFCTDAKYSNHLSSISKKIYATVAETIGVKFGYEKHVEYAARLSMLGLHMHYRTRHRDGMHLVLGVLEFQLTHKDIVLIAALMRYHENKPPAPRFLKKFKDLLPSTQTVLALSYIVTLAQALLYRRNNSYDYAFEMGSDDHLIVYYSNDGDVYFAKEQISYIESPIDLHIEFRKRN